MNYPLISEYKEAIKSAEDNFNELSNLRPVLGEDGEPVMTSGNFAVVFKMKNEQTGKLHAVKCFLKEQEGRTEAYRMIAEELEYVNSTFLTPIKYLDKELFVDSSNSEDSEFPVLLMGWVEGQSLDKYIREHIDDQYELSLLAYQFSRLAMWLMPQPFAHGDLKPDNILVKDDGTLALVDYDGMYVPAMKGQKARELGSPDFRHPSRTENDFDEHIDDFSLASILLSLKAISLQPSLLEEYGASDRLLFSEKDYRNLSESQVMDALKPMMQDAELASLYSLYILALSQNNLSQVSFRLFNLSRPEKLQYEEEIFSTEVTETDLVNAWVDEYGVKYSEDRKRLLYAPSNLVDYYILEGTVTICDESFGCYDYCNEVLNSVVIPNSVLNIGNASFKNCEVLSKVVLPNTLKRIGKNAFSGCKTLNNINIPDSVIRIDEGAFRGCESLVKLNIPQRLTCISAETFSECAFTNITIPDSVVKIGWGAFMGCVNLLEITIPRSVKQLEGFVFYGCSSLSNVTLPDHITVIASELFAHCSIKEFTIPNTVTTIESRAFWDCELSHISIPNSVITIGEGAFYGCSLSQVNIPNSVSKIESETFYDCFCLKKINLPNSISEICESAFYNCALESVVIPNSVKLIGEQAFCFCQDLMAVTLPDSLLEIESGAFSCCYSLTSITIPLNVKNIKGNVFANCTNLKEIIVAKANPYYDSRENSNSIIESTSNILITGCQSSIIPDGVTKIGESAFVRCYHLRQIGIPESVTEIGNYAFMFCEGLSRVTIPNSVKKLGESSFYCCYSLEIVIICSSTLDIEEDAFSGCDAIKEIYIPSGSMNNYEKLLPGYKDKLIEMGNRWIMIKSRSFCHEEIILVDHAEVVSSEYGKRVCFYMRSGDNIYIPLSNSSTLCVGDAFDINSAKYLTLTNGEHEINRVIEYNN